jgi:hypothetical protein
LLYYFIFIKLEVEAHYIDFLHGNSSRGLFFSFSNIGVLSISNSIITKESTTILTMYSFLSLGGGSSQIFSSIDVTSVSFGGNLTISLINIAGCRYQISVV